MKIAIDKDTIKLVNLNENYIYLYDDEPLEELIKTGLNCIYYKKCKFVDINLTDYDIDCIKKAKPTDKDFDKIEREYANTYPRIKLVELKQKRYNGGARNEAYLHLSDDVDYVYYVDSDDWLYDEYCLEKINNKLQSKPDVLFVGMARYRKDLKTCFIPEYKDKYEPENNVIYNTSDGNIPNATTINVYNSPPNYINNNNMTFLGYDKEGRPIYAGNDRYRTINVPVVAQPNVNQNNNINNVTNNTDNTNNNQ